MEWSPIGQKLVEQGTDLFCPKCKYKLKGERNCPSCGTKIIYAGENPDGTENRMMKLADSADRFAKKTNEFSKSASSFGASMTLGCTIPIIIIILILMFLL